MNKTLIEKRNELLADYQKLQDEAKTRTWTNEDLTRSDNMLGELEAIDKQFDAEEKYNKIQARSAERANKAVLEASGTATVSDERKAFRHYLRTGQVPSEMRTNLSEGTNSAGGYLAPVDLAKELLKIVIEESNIRPKTKVVETTLKAIPFPYKSAGPTGSWVAEGGTISASQSIYASTSVGINKYAFFTSISRELLKDALFDMEAQILDDIAIECSRGEEAGFVAGSGSNQPMGLITTGSAPTYNGVTAFHSGASGSFTGDNLITLMHSLKQPYIYTGEWFMHRETFGAVASMKTSAGQYLFAPMGYGYLGGEGFVSTILSRPVNFSPDMPISVLAGGTGNPNSVLYTDPKRSYRIVQKPAQDLLNIVVDPYTGASTGMINYWCEWRVGGGVVMPEAVAVLVENT